MTSVCVVTGAAGAMGSACAVSIGAAAEAFLLTDRDEAGLGRVAERVRHHTESAVSTMTGDIADPEFVRELAGRAAGLGSLHSLVDTAGLSPSMADWRDILRVDLVSVATLLEAFLDLAVAGSTVVCLASIAGQLGEFDPATDAVLDAPLAADFEARFGAGFDDEPDPGTTYRLAKRGVIRLCESAAVEWGERGGRVLSVSPGLIDTEMGRLELRQIPMKQQLVDSTPLHLPAGDSRGPLPGRTQDIADVVAYLCSEQAAFITGCDIRVDGGLVAALSRPAPAADGSAPTPEGNSNG